MKRNLVVLSTRKGRKITFTVGVNCLIDKVPVGGVVTFAAQPGLLYRILLEQNDADVIKCEELNSKFLYDIQRSLMVEDWAAGDLEVMRPIRLLKNDEFYCRGQVFTYTRKTVQGPQLILHTTGPNVVVEDYEKQWVIIGYEPHVRKTPKTSIKDLLFNLRLAVTKL